MTSTIAPFTVDQIGTGTARFPSGVAIPTLTDAAADPYIQTRVSKHVQVDCIQFWPQEKGLYPGLVLLHEAWGLTAQIKDLGARLACEGYGVIIPNLYGRLGGMVTANAEVADALMGKLNESLVLQDINSCCEFLNTRDHIKRNIHGVVGYGMGGSYALRFACQRKRLRAAVVYYGRVMQPETAIKDLFCPVLYHQAGQDRGCPVRMWTGCVRLRPNTTNASRSRLTPMPPMRFVMNNAWRAIAPTRRQRPGSQLPRF